MKERKSRILEFILASAFLAAAMAGCGPLRATECVTQITEACEAGLAKVSDITMYYEIHGSGEPIIVLHGAGGSIETMKNGIAALAEDYRVIAVDTRGHGRTTDADQPFSNELFARDIVELMDLLEMDKAHVLGLSDGGVTGLALAINYPERINKLVTIGANFTPDGLTDMVVEWMRDSENSAKVPVPPVYEQYAPDPAKWPTLLEKLYTMTLSGPIYTYEDLGKIEAPTLVMMGERDEFIRVEHTEELHRSIANSVLFIVPNAGHNVFVFDQYTKGDEVDQANRAILEFLRAD